MALSDRTMKERVQAFGISKALDMIKTDPDTNVPKLLDWVDKVTPKDALEPQRAMFRKIVDEDNMWYRFIKSFWTDIDDGQRQTFFNNFFINSTVIGTQRAKKNREENDCNIPWAILMDPTSACNLKCTGCWAAEYGDRLSMDYETLSNIVRQGKALGTYMYVLSGGEPLVRKKDIIKLCEEHDDCMFLAFTNGTLIDEEFADEMLRVKNFAPAISIEGYEESTDARRGEGTYKKVINAMKLLKERKLIFGASLCYTSQNTHIIGSDEYFDFLIDQGAKFAWYFTYMPVGVGSPTELIATPEQREYMFHQIRKYRNLGEGAKPIFTMDFWNDGEFVDGCIAGGRYYCHINANGDIEPCAFIHYSDTNIHDGSLLDAFKNPLFQQYRKGQPFNDNLMRPCPLLDNPQCLNGMVKESGAHSTDLSAPENIDDLCAKCKGASEKWAPVAERLWMEKRDKAI